MMGRTTTSALAILAIAACAPSDQENRDKAPSFGYELAVADQGPGTLVAVAETSVEASVIDLSVEELRAKLDAGNIRLIDVRTDAEVAEGMIPGAEHIALDTFEPAALNLSDGREVIFYCRSGRRSGLAGEQLAAHTGKPAHHLAGGISAWTEAGQPIT